MITIPFEGGKYIIESGAGFSRVLRYGERWLDLNSMPGSKFFVSLVDELAAYHVLMADVNQAKYEAASGDNTPILDVIRELLVFRDKYYDLKGELSKANPVTIYPPQYHYEGMGCGLEDRDITDRYQAMQFGWDQAIERFQECIPEELYERPQLAIPDGWLPTAENINKLPGPVRSYIHELTANSDPSGTIQENVFLKDLLRAAMPYIKDKLFPSLVKAWEENNAKA